MKIRKCFLSFKDTPTPPVTTQAETRSDSASPQVQTSTARVTSLPISPFTAQASTMMPAVRHLIPVPLSSLNGSGSFDSALPCHSVWALDTSRRRHNAGGSRTAVSVQRYFELLAVFIEQNFCMYMQCGRCVGGKILSL